MSDIKNVVISVDMREGRSGIPARLEQIPGVEIQTVDLLCADYAVGDQLGIERKTANDFIASILDKRLFEQSARLQTEYQRGMLLIEGDVYSTRTAISFEAIDGALSWLSLLSGLSILHVPNTARSAGLIHRLALHQEHGHGYDVPLRAAKPKDSSMAAQFLVEGLPSVGATTSIKLLNHFGSPSAVFKATDAQLSDVPGIGPKIISRIREVLDFTKG
jgi:Fanconi anemia group M protein